MKTKLISVGNYYNVCERFEKLFSESYILTSPEIVAKLIDKNTTVLFGGGEDITSAIYGVERHETSQAGHVLSKRDEKEIEIFNLAQKVGAKSLGICRGAQLLCALSGGKLVQNVTGHTRNHTILTKDKERYTTSSVHHQMMYPFELKDKYQMIAWSEDKLSKYYDMSPEVTLDKLEIEPEIIYFDETKSLAIQGHPEFMDERASFVKYSQQLVQEFLL